MAGTSGEGVMQLTVHPGKTAVHDELGQTV
jgi:hypothetical protein